MIRKIVPIASKKVEQITRNKIEQTICKQTEISKNQDVYTPHFKAYLDNLPDNIIEHYNCEKSQD